MVRDYGSDKPFKVMGIFNTDVSNEVNQRRIQNCELIVIQGNAEPSLGCRDAIRLGFLKIEIVMSLTEPKWIQKISRGFTKDKNKIGELKDFKLKISVNQKVNPAV